MSHAQAYKHATCTSMRISGQVLLLTGVGSAVGAGVGSGVGTGAVGSGVGDCHQSRTQEVITCTPLATLQHFCTRSSAQVIK
jgi:hypothetical protein